VLPLYITLKEQIIDKLDGFYAATLINPARTEAICLRDAMGKKPLFVGKAQGVIFISSELKALPHIEWFKALPKGICSVNLHSGAITLLGTAQQQPAKPTRTPAATLKKALIHSVKKRLPHAKQPLGVLLSGGLDSAIIASIVAKLRPDAVYFTLGDSHGQDTIAAQSVVAHLKLKHWVTVPLPTAEALPQLIQQTVFATESYNPSIISNGLATFLLAQAARNMGIKVVLTGEGADELFGGYHQFLAHEPWQQTRHQLINDMSFTELRRLDMACMANGIEPRCPFLDPKVRALSETMHYSQLYGYHGNKLILRQAFTTELPSAILYRKKTSCDVGSGIRSLVVRYLTGHAQTERAALLQLWQQQFLFDPQQPYFSAYPVFDAAIAKRGEQHR